ncbi:hypothetical protein [Kingella potus]|uniref:hypothetical protein n=1 Tax=Kingella potus TaxID=265175 RepID=UPI001FD49BB3|nr:hypothetical protein [Kingella potus]UOP01514.1 hypothetical protein LVJ84_04800 [Kingella potus]
MSMNSVYLWYPAHFPDPAAMLPESLSAAQQIADEWAEKPLPAGADPSPFAELAAIIAKAARSKEASAGFRQSYAGIETDLPAYLRGHALAELSEHYDEIMPLLDDYAPDLGLVLYDSNGTACSCPTVPQLSRGRLFCRHPARAGRKSGSRKKMACRQPGLPENIKDFYKYFRPKTDELMGRYGFEYAPQFFNVESHKRKKLEPDVIIYAKPTEHGWQLIYISIHDIYKDGVYDIRVSWNLSDETVEQIYWYELENISPYAKKNNKKQLAEGGVNIGYYLSSSWDGGYIGSSKFKTESQIEAFLAYIETRLAEVASISAYGDLEAYFNSRLGKASEYKDISEKLNKNIKTYNDFPIVLVDLYLEGRRNLREVVESWLAADDAYFGNKEFARERLMKTLTYLENRPRT